ncbi:MAG: hypothetical protein JXL80_02160 [Planctomycetes bacterium]|nr:hypothetical protein [Planctomycetota bacterium]
MTASRRVVTGMMLGCVVLGVVALGARAETPGETDAEFFMTLSYKQVAMMDDACKAVALLVRGQFDMKDAAACRDFLVERKIARSSWPTAADAPLTKGRLAYMVCQALGIKGGVTMRLFGPSQRYCLAECEYLELITGGADYEHVTGGELVSVIDRADQYRQAKGQAAEPQAAPEAAAPVAAAQPAKAAPVAAAAPKMADQPAEAKQLNAPAANAKPAVVEVKDKKVAEEKLPEMTPIEPEAPSAAGGQGQQ